MKSVNVQYISFIRFKYMSFYIDRQISVPASSACNDKDDGYYAEAESSDVEGNCIMYCIFVQYVYFKVPFLSNMSIFVFSLD